MSVLLILHRPMSRNHSIHKSNLLYHRIRNFCTSTICLTSKKIRRKEVLLKFYLHFICCYTFVLSKSVITCISGHLPSFTICVLARPIKKTNNNHFILLLRNKHGKQLLLKQMCKFYYVDLISSSSLYIRFGLHIFVYVFLLISKQFSFILLDNRWLSNF